LRAESGGAARPPRSRIPSPRARPRSSCCRGVLRSRVRALTGQINRICQYALRNPTLHDNERELTVECGEIGRRTGCVTCHRRPRGRRPGLEPRARRKTRDTRLVLCRAVVLCGTVPLSTSLPSPGREQAPHPPFAIREGLQTAARRKAQANQSPRTQNSFGRLGSLGADSTEEPRVDFSAACRSEKT